jgi:Domain of unknown function (DUF397)
MVQRETFHATWRRSRHCDGGTCVEVAQTPFGLVAVRDGADSSRPPLLFTPDGWAGFMTRAKSSGFDPTGRDARI